MRLLIVTPLQPEATGNRVTALRYREEMEARGHEVLLVMTDEQTPVLLQRALDDFRPDLVHLLHAYRSGRPWLDCTPPSPISVVVTLTGTDIHGGIDSPTQGPVIRQVLERADAVITQNSVTCAELKGSTDAWVERLTYLPPGIVLGHTPYPLKQLHDIPSGHVLFLHPAGIRQVKGNLELLRLFDAVAAKRSGFTVAFCGPVLEESYCRQFLAELGERHWARYLGTIPTASMAAALGEADVVLNNSSCEGLSNVLVEATVLGRPLLVRNIPGNAAVVEERVNGLLFGDADDFIRKALALIDSADLRQTLSRPVPERFDPAEEARVLAAIYREVLSSSRGGHIGVLKI
jgi:glycosyltransferase involved in cell wall biosynthesis